MKITCHNLLHSQALVDLHKTVCIQWMKMSEINYMNMKVAHHLHHLHLTHRPLSHPQAAASIATSCLRSDDRTTSNSPNQLRQDSKSTLTSIFTLYYAISQFPYVFSIINWSTGLLCLKAALKCDLVLGWQKHIVYSMRYILYASNFNPFLLIRIFRLNVGMGREPEPWMRYGVSLHSDG